MKKVLKYTGIGLLSLLVLAFTLPLLFKGKIVSAVKSGINKNIEAKVDFKDVSLSLFRHFPQLSVSLENIAVTGLGEFAKDTLVSAPSIAASEPSAFRVQLEKYAIKNGYVYYRDESGDMTAEITGLNHEGKGNLDQ